MFAHCARCETAIPLLDGTPAPFCANCGLPQLRVAEEFSAAERSGAAVQNGPGAGRAGALDWPLALRITASAACIGVVPCALLPGALLYGVAGIFAVLLLPLCALICGAVYQRRRPQREFTAGMGARIGTALGILLAALTVAATGVAGFLVRYAVHSRALEQALEGSIVQFILRMQANGTPLDARTIGILGWAEVRSGLFVGMQVAEVLLLIAVGALSGALTGAVLHARWKRTQAG